VKARSKRLVRRSASVVALITLAVIAFLIVTHWLARLDRRANPDPSSKPIAPPMVHRENGVLVIDDYNAWFEVLPRAIRAAMRRGNRDAESILVDVFSSILPDQTWPPRPGAPDRWQWQEMVARTAELLEPRPTPTDRPGLRVVM